MELAACFGHYYMNTAHYNINNNTNRNIDERYEYWKQYACEQQWVWKRERERERDG